MRLIKDLKSVRNIKKKNIQFVKAFKTVILACLKLINDQEIEEEDKKNVSKIRLDLTNLNYNFIYRIDRKAKI